MVKTKPAAAKKVASKPQGKPAAAKAKQEEPTHRPAGDWWQDILSGETCRTSDLDKVRNIVERCSQQGKGINIQGLPERGNYFFYITRIMTQKETTR